MPTKDKSPTQKSKLLPFHPLADIFPLMEGDELNELVGDIQRRGLKLPIWIFERKVLDGRNRVRACNTAGYDLKDVDTKQFEGTTEDATRFVISMNIHRRQLKPEKRRELLKKLLAMSPGMSDRAIATMAKVSPTTVGSARRGMEEANVQTGHKARVEKSGRQARGRKPGSGKPKPPSPEQTAAREQAAKRIRELMGKPEHKVDPPAVEPKLESMSETPAAVQAPELAVETKSSPTLHCSFCGKSQHQVRALIAGPSAWICNECVDLCVNILRKELAGSDTRSRKAQDDMCKELSAAEAMNKLH